MPDGTFGKSVRSLGQFGETVLHETISNDQAQWNERPTVDRELKSELWLFTVSLGASALGGTLDMASGIFIVPVLTYPKRPSDYPGSDVLSRFARERVPTIATASSNQVVKPTGLFPETLSIGPRRGSNTGLPCPTNDYFGQQ